MKKIIFIILAILILIVGVIVFVFSVNANPERFQGVGGNPVGVALIDKDLYIYDAGSKVATDCWCALAGVVLSKPVIWLVNPQTKSLKGFILEDDPQFLVLKKKIDESVSRHLITSGIASTNNGWIIRLEDYPKKDVWSNKKLVIENLSGLLVESRPIEHRYILFRLDSNNKLYVVSEKLVPIENPEPENVEKFHSGELGPRVQDTITDTWNRVDNVLVVIDLYDGTIQEEYTFGESFITHYISSDDLMLDDGQRLYVKRGGWRDTSDDSIFKIFTGVFDKEEKIARHPNEQEEYALLSPSLWFDNKLIIAARTSVQSSSGEPVGNAQLRIIDRQTDRATDLTLDVPKNKLSRLAYGSLQLVGGTLIGLTLLIGSQGVFLVVILLLLFVGLTMWFIRFRRKKIIRGRIR